MDSRDEVIGEHIHNNLDEIVKDNTLAIIEILIDLGYTIKSPHEKWTINSPI